MILETVRELREAVGSNRRGPTIGSWFFLLPSLDIRHAGIVGSLDEGLRDQLILRGIKLVELATPAEIHRAVQDALTHDRALQLVLIGPVDEEAAGAAAAAIGDERRVPVVVLAADGELLVNSDAQTLVAVEGSREPDGHEAVPGSVLRCHVPASTDRSWARRGRAVGLRLLRRVAPERVPAHDPSRPQLLAPSSHPLPSVAGPTIFLPRGSSVDQVPTYIAQAATRAGISLDGYRWSFAPPRGFPSQKLLFVLAPPSTDQPTYVVKIPQLPTYTPRIANEYRALLRLQQLGVTRVPRPAFLDASGDLAFVAQRGMPGRPFRDAWSGTLPDALADAVASWATELGRLTAQPVTTDELGGSLDDLVGTFCRLYQPDAEVARHLKRVVDSLARSTLPTVLQHGDLGNWNLLVDDDAVTVLDWESAEFRGLPLWDLYYFAQTLGVFAAARRGIRYRGSTFTQQLLRDSDLSRWLASNRDRYCEAVGLDEDAAELLLPMCFVYHAVKEARRLDPRRLRHGRYQELVRLTLARSERSLVSARVAAV